MDWKGFEREGSGFSEEKEERMKGCQKYSLLYYWEDTYTSYFRMDC